MKSPIKIILIIFAILQFLIVLYITFPSIPKKLKTETLGGQYVLEDLSLSFDLDSNNYEIVSEDENLEDGRNTIILAKPEDKDRVYLSQILDKKYPEFLNEKFSTLQNPFQSRFAINLNKKGIKESYQKGTPEQKEFKDMKIQIYEGEDRKFILTQFIFNDGSIDYTAEGYIGNNYYAIDPSEKSNLEIILRFMETATVIQN